MIQESITIQKIAQEIKINFKCGRYTPVGVFFLVLFQKNNAKEKK
jgi:hypothetical protein